MGCGVLSKIVGDTQEPLLAPPRAVGSRLITLMLEDSDDQNGADAFNSNSEDRFIAWMI